MRTLARPIGLGLAARGDADDVVRWARQARDVGLDSIWIHDSYFERDAITFGSAVASALAQDGEDDGEAGFRVALGAVNPFTRHPVVLAMTGSALDEILPGPDRDGPRHRAAACGSSRWASPTSRRRPSSACPRRSTSSARCGPASACRRPRAGLPPIQPMFPPTHRIPLFIAAYRKEFVALAGQKADGYLARPAESIPSPARDPRAPARVGRRGRARPGGHRDRRLSPVARRRDAARGAQPGQARAVRDLHDVGPVRRLPAREPASRPTCATGSPPPGGPRTTRPPATSSPTSCSTRSCSAARARTSRPGRWPSTPRRAWSCRSSSRCSRRSARSTSSCAAAALYAAAPEPAGRQAAERSVATVGGSAVPRALRTWATTGRIDRWAWPTTAGSAPARCLRRRAGAVWEILRPFAYTASVDPGRGRRRRSPRSTAGSPGRRSWPPCSGRCSSTRARTSSTRSTTSARASTRSPAPRASHAIVKGRLTEREAFARARFALRAGRRGRRCTWSRCAVRPIVGARPARPRRRLLLHGPAVPVQVPRARRPAGVPADGAADGRRRLLRGHRRVVGRRRSSLSIPVGLPRRGDPPRQRVARHRRGHPGRAS